jgi:peptidoglycan/xylan/chitin deacetylase (PgdA/CDA1 family)
MTGSWQVPILTYHALHAPGWEYHENDHIALEQDLALIDSLGFRVVPLSVLVSHLFNKPDARLEQGTFVALSFDDGPDVDYIDFHHPDWGSLLSFYSLLLKWPELGWDGGTPVGTSFVIASPVARAELDRTCIAGRNEWRDDWWLEAATQGTLEIANHSWDHTHNSLASLVVGPEHRGTFSTISSFEDADAEILNAEKFIREKTNGKSTPLFAYPYGENNDFLIDEYFPARSQWIRAAFATGGEPVTKSSNRWNLPRYVCGDHWKTSDELMRILTLSAR